MNHDDAAGLIINGIGAGQSLTIYSSAQPILASMFYQGNPVLTVGNDLTVLSATNIEIFGLSGISIDTQPDRYVEIGSSLIHNLTATEIVFADDGGVYDSNRNNVLSARQIVNLERLALSGDNTDGLVAQLNSIISALTAHGLAI